MHMQALAKVAGGSVTILSHPSLAGIASGSGLSGSTAWHGAFRFRQYLKGIKNERRRSARQRSARARIQEEPVRPDRPDHRAAVPERPVPAEDGRLDLDRLAREAEGGQMFVDLLRRFTDPGRQRQPQERPPRITRPRRSPKSRKPKRRSSERTTSRTAMRRLFAAGRILVETYGRPSQPSSRLAVKPPAEGET